MPTNPNPLTPTPPVPQAQPASTTFPRPAVPAATPVQQQNPNPAYPRPTPQPTPVSQRTTTNPQSPNENRAATGTPPAGTKTNAGSLPKDALVRTSEGVECKAGSLIVTAQVTVV